MELIIQVRLMLFPFYLSLNSLIIYLLYNYMNTILFLAILSVAFCKENFTYLLSDVVPIENNSYIQVTNGILTRNNQNIDPEQVTMLLSLLQTQTNSNYNIYYFKLNDDQGITCYQGWIQNNQIGNVINCTSNIDTNSPCTKYINCANNSVSASVQINPQVKNFSEGLFFLENPNQSTIKIKVTYTFIMLASNGWFFGGVALICVLLLNIVIFSGLAFFWSLKYKRTKKLYQQYKLMNNA